MALRWACYPRLFENPYSVPIRFNILTVGAQRSTGYRINSRDPSSPQETTHFLARQWKAEHAMPTAEATFWGCHRGGGKPGQLDQDTLGLAF